VTDRRAYHALYHSIHAEERRQYAREWRRKNAARVRAYREENASERAAQARAARYRRRVAKWLAETEIVVSLWAEVNDVPRPSPIDPQALVIRWDETGVTNTCARGCGRGWREIVHAVPLYAGGVHDVSNLVPVCGRCERNK
jgi:FMN phosphatase YigB (HAD superfamily)